jgi:hypothetical protein
MIKICSCGTLCSFDPHEMRYGRTCKSRKCIGNTISSSKELRTKSDLDNFRAKFKKTMSSKSKEELDLITTKRKLTNITKYGVEHPWSSPIIRNKIKVTVDKKYHCNNFSTSLISPQSKMLLDDKEWLYDQHYNLQKPLYVIAQELDVGDRTVGVHLKKHGFSTKLFQHSNWEMELSDFLNEHNIVFTKNNRDVIKPRELDFFLPDANVAIELCGLYWHSDKHERIDNNYHYQKYIRCKELGIQLLTIFEDEWKNKELIFNKILHLTNKSTQQVVYARNTTIDNNILMADRKRFFELNHVQGDGKGSIVIGLRNNTNELVAASIFSKHENHEYKLVRFATSQRVIGGFSKIINNFETNYSDYRIITTFSDNRWSTGQVYKSNGFDVITVLKPDYQYVQQGKRVHKFNFRHKSLKKRLKHYDPLVSESQNCVNNGIYRVWDCGKIGYGKFRVH